MITIKEAEEILKKDYHRDNFLYLLNDVLLPDYKKNERDINFNNTIFSDVVQLGMSKKCDVVIFEVGLIKNVQNRRVAITQEMFRILRGQRINNALVAFYNIDRRNYRISLLTSKYEFDGDKIKKVISNPRRYSYYLGYLTKTNTAYKFLIGKGKVSSYDDLVGRFSVEVVNKQFYNEIALNFTKLVGGERDGKEYKPLLKIQGRYDHKKYSEFAVRIIGRIVFCWFLKEKKSKNNISLIPDNLLSIQAIDEYENYYHTILEPLFFEILNTEQKDRKDKFGRDEIFKKIPYLNGGLFSPHDDDHYEYSTATESGIFGIVTIPDKWFKDLFSVFEEYNFTVDENTTYDIELSIDPEMLGRIFENLLAEINPETGESAKKMTGSFYTPREIVEYMVDNSFHDYLHNRTNIESEKLKNVINYSKGNDVCTLSEIEKKKIINAIYSLTIIDPACGSGAFPIGMLQKIVYVLQEIDPTAELWFEKAIDNILIRKEIVKKFSIGALDFIRKLSVIQKSIFGVDIQPIAVEISRLRCFLSLIIEEKVSDNEENRGINPLPNLDFKFVIANTLVKLDNNPDTILFEDISHIDSLINIRDEYFNADDKSREDLRKKFMKIQKEMVEVMIKYYKDATSSRYFSLLDWNPFEYKNTKWFDTHLMFGIKEGFDIVIGNPPYVFARNSKSKGMTNMDKTYYYKNYILSEYQINLYPLFIEKGTNLLKNNGILCYITPNNWLTLNTNKKLRQFILKQSNINILNFYKRVFKSADVDAAIVSFKKSNSEITCENIELAEWEKEYTFICEIEKEKFINSKDFIINIEALKGNKTFDLLNKIEDNGVPLSTFAKVKCGLGAYGNGDGIPPQTKEMIKNRVYHSKNKEGDDWYEYIEGEDVKRYECSWNKQEYLKYGKHLREPRNDWNLFSTPRILVRQIPSPLPYCINACYVEETLLNDRNSMNIVYIKVSPLYLLGILNSRLISYWFFHKFGKLQRGIFPQFKINELTQFPIPNISNKKQQTIISIVNKILSSKRKNPSADTVSLEKDIDALVYELYGLTNNEIAIIEGNI